MTHANGKAPDGSWREAAGGRWRALLLDVDGTLVDDFGAIHPRTRAALHAAHERGVLVMIVTGRSESGAEPVVEALGLDTPVVVYNGTGLWCPKTRRLLEERVLSNRSVAATLACARERGYLPVVMKQGEKAAPAPRTPSEERALSRLTELRCASFEELPREYVIRITLFSDQHASSSDFMREIEAYVDQPLYMTHFPLSHLADHKDSALQVVDVHPPCAGKGEALRMVEERYGIRPEQVVAVGDASNDVPMFERAGLAVAMEQCMPEARAAAGRSIGSCNGDAIGLLVEELFL